MAETAPSQPANMHHLEKLREYEYLLDGIIVKALVGLVGLLALSVIAHKVFIRQRPDEPPIHKGWIPWYGNYFDMDKNPEKLLTKLRKKYGDIFSIWTAGQKMTIVLDILEGIPAMYRNTRQMEFHEFERQLQAPVFGYPLEYRDDLKCQAELHELTNTYTIKSESVQWLTGQFQTALDELMGVELKKRGTDGFVIDMTDWGRYCMYTASLKSLLGLHFPAQEDQMFRDFLAWEWDFVNMSKGKPHYMVKKGWDARERIFKRIAKEMEEYEDLVTPFIKQRIEIHRKYGFEPNSRAFASGMLQLIFVLGANTLPTGFWFVVIAFSKPEYTKLIRDRVALYVKDPKSTKITSKAFDVLAMEKDPILLSFFSEVLRLKASVWSFRLVLEDAVLGSGGKEYFFPKGSTLWIPVTVVHRDGEVYQEPLQFKPDRFLKVEHEQDESGHDSEKLTRKVLFNKRGKATRMGHLPFGGGKSMCPGRNFARAIVLTYAATLLHFFDIELLAPLPELRPADRFGLGVELPIEPLPARVSIRKL